MKLDPCLPSAQQKCMATNKKPGKWRARTLAVRAGTLRTPFQETSEALFLTSGYAYEARGRSRGPLQGRGGRLSVQPLRQSHRHDVRAAHGRARRRAGCARHRERHGRGQRDASVCACSTGDHVVAAKAMFGSCRHVIEEILPRFGITQHAGRRRRCRPVAPAMRPETKMLFLETPANPTLAIVDMKAVAKIAHEAGARLIVDNAFATPGAAAPVGVRRPHRGPFLDQIYRRPGPLRSAA